MLKSRSEAMSFAALIVSILALAIVSTGAGAAPRKAGQIHFVILANQAECKEWKKSHPDPAYACGWPGPESVNTNALANGAVTSGKVDDGALKAQDFSTGATKGPSAVGQSFGLTFAANAGTGEMILGSGDSPSPFNQKFESLQVYPTAQQANGFKWQPCVTKPETPADPEAFSCFRVPVAGLYTIQVTAETFGSEGKRNIGALITGTNGPNHWDSFDPANGYQTFSAGLVDANTLGISEKGARLQTATKTLQLKAGQAVLALAVWQNTSADLAANVGMTITLQ